MTKIDVNFRSDIDHTLNKLFAVVESRRQVQIPLSVRVFFAEVIAESLLVRSSEWQLREGLDFDLDADRERGIVVAGDVVVNILNSAETYQPSGLKPPVVSLIGVLSQISQHWCGIFPFCR